MAGVEIKRVQKKYGETVVIPGIDLSIRSGEFMVLVGPSGCGKSTLLRMIAGLEAISGGEISIDGKVVNDLSPKARGVAMVFQNYALYPHMTVRENMAFSLKLSKIPKETIDKKIQDVSKVLGLDDQLAKKPGQLSGGQKQRVAMGRAMVREPKVFLFDEPLSNLDAQLRVKMRSEISLLHRRSSSTAVYVTHDQVEAMTLADRIAVMYRGKLQQVGTPLEVYHQPKTQFVAGFIGTPSMNFLPVLHFAKLPLPAGAVTVGFRPDAAELDGGVTGVRFIVGNAKVALVEPLGTLSYVHVDMDGQMLVAELRADKAPAPDTEVTVSVDPGTLFFFDAEGNRVGAPA